MDTPLPPFRPHRIQLVGHHNLGIIPARFDGPWLELESGTRHGPCAVFSAEPVPEPVAQPEPAPVGAWGGHTDWIAWGGGDRPVDRDCLVGAAFRAGGYVIGVPAGGFGWQRLGHGGDIIAYRIVQPEPAPRVDRTIYNPDDIRRGDRHTLTDGTRGTVLGVIDGWIAYSDRLPVVQHCNCIVRVEPVDPDDIPF